MWVLQIKARERHDDRKLLKPAVMPSYGTLSMRDWRNYPMPVKIDASDMDLSTINTTIDGRFLYGDKSGNTPLTQAREYLRVGGDIFLDTHEPMETLEIALERWEAYPKWNEMQYDFRLVDEETGETIPLFLL